MIDSFLKDRIRQFLSNLVGTSIANLEFSPVGGGSINKTYKISVDKRTNFFCKINEAARFPCMFEQEKKGLELLAGAGMKVPKVIGTCIEKDQQILILDWIDQGIRSRQFWQAFGQQLAALHSVQGPYAGLEEDNYMGALRQSNTVTSEWISFFIHHRLEPQTKLAYNNKLLQPKHINQFENLYKKLPEVFPENTLCLLHGDLWSGNFLCDNTANPVLIDPAVYYGYPGMDLAMTTLFGGFDSLFYDVYNHHLPFSTNHRQQWEICNLYPLLIHLNNCVFIPVKFIV